MSRDGMNENSLRSLPPGKLQNLKKLFEEKDAESSGATLFGMSDSPPKTSAGATRGRPMSNVVQTRLASTSGPGLTQPKPAPRHGSPPSRKTWMASDFNSPQSKVVAPTSSREVTPTTFGSLPRSRQRRSSEKTDASFTSSTLERKSVAAAVAAAAQKVLTPTGRVARFATDQGNLNGGGGGGGGAANRPGYVGGSGKVDVEQRRLGNPAARSGSPKRLSGPSADTDVGGASYNKRVSGGERRRTVDSVSLIGGDQRPGDVKVLEQLRRFEDKPDLPTKPVIPLIGQQMASVMKAQRKAGERPGERSGVGANNEVEIRPGRNLRAITDPTIQRSSMPVNIPLGGRSAAGKLTATSGGTRLSSIPLSPPKTSPPAAPGAANKQTVRPLEHPPPPPPPSKPPRTYAHEEYLEAKLFKPGASGGGGGKNSGPDKEGGGGEYSVSSVRDRVAFLSDGGSDNVKQEVTLRGDNNNYSHLKDREGGGKGGVRETPPSRPPPPRPRPTSEGSALHRRLDASSGGSDSESEGPIVISLKKGRRLDRQVSVSGPHRDPINDCLPETPSGGGGGDSLQRFPLRKSFSSECLFKGSMSSLSSHGDDDPSSGTLRGSSMMRSCHAQNGGGGGGGENMYEAMIDGDGYAVPHEFLRIGAAGEAKDCQGAAGSNNKPGFLKRVLGTSSSSGGGTPPTLPTTTPLKEQDMEKVPRKKMNLVKQKINQAYETLNLAFGRPTFTEEDEQDNPDSTEDRDSTDTDSIVDVQEIKRRVTYCSTVRLKTYQSVKKSRDFLDGVYSQLFEYALIVGLCPKTDHPGYEPYVIHKFPQIVDSNVAVPKFCFPDAEEFRPGSVTATSESYAFVLTDIDGSRLFGYCRRIQPRDASLPEVICIVSPVNAFNMYNKLLSDLESRRYKSLDYAQEMIAASFGRPLPKPGKICHIRCLLLASLCPVPLALTQNEDADMETVFVERPADDHLDNVNYESLLQYLGTDKMIKVFASMLMERRLILCSNNLSVLTQTIHALSALLYPFHWPHVYIPLLPPDMLEVCAAPMPFIAGILRTHLARVLTLELEDVIVVDLDKKQVIRSMGDELNLLPKKVQKALKTAINLCRIDSDARNSQWLVVSEAFLRMFLETMGHFGQHICTQQDGTKTLLRDQFIAGAPSKGIRHFLEWFTETQMFEVFIQMHLEKQHWGSMDLFMQRLGELQAERQAKGSQSKGIGQKVKNLGKVIKTKLKEAT